MDSIDNCLGKKYSEYLDLVSCLCEYYDSSDKGIIALSLSTAIRVLLHDTKKSTSLLAHLGKKNISFMSTNIDLNNNSVHLGLVRRINIGVKDGVGGEAKYWPLCKEQYFPMPKSKVFLDFDTWWSKEIIFRSGIHSLTRKDLVLTITNKDGGAHFDEKIDKKYDAFRHSWSGGSSLFGINSKAKRGYDNIPTYPAIRQISYELLCSLKS